MTEFLAKNIKSPELSQKKLPTFKWKQGQIKDDEDKKTFKKMMSNLYYDNFNDENLYT